MHNFLGNRGTLQDRTIIRGWDQILVCIASLVAQPSAGKHVSGTFPVRAGVRRGVSHYQRQCSWKVLCHHSTRR